MVNMPMLVKPTGRFLKLFNLLTQKTHPIAIQGTYETDIIFVHRQAFLLIPQS